MSGVTVPTMMSVYFLRVDTGPFQAIRAARNCHVRVPEPRVQDTAFADSGRLMIHSSLVSTIFSRSMIGELSLGKEAADRANICGAFEHYELTSTLLPCTTRHLSGW